MVLMVVVAARVQQLMPRWMRRCSWRRMMAVRMCVVLVVVVMMMIVSVTAHRRQDAHAQVGLVTDHPDGHVAHVATVKELISKH